MAISELWQLIQRDPPGSHQLFAPADSKVIAQAERALGLQFPRSFQRFHKLCSGAILFKEETLLGLGADCPEELQLVAAARRFREQGMPRYLLPFSPTPEGVDCFDCRGRLDEGEYPVVYWNEPEGASPPTHDSFDEWLFELTEALREEPVDLSGLAPDDDDDDDDPDGDDPDGDEDDDEDQAEDTNLAVRGNR